MRQCLFIILFKIRLSRDAMISARESRSQINQYKQTLNKKHKQTFKNMSKTSHFGGEGDQAVCNDQFRH